MNRIQLAVRSSWKGPVCVLTLALILNCTPERAWAASKVKLEEALLQRAPEILKELQNRGVRHVGVLKFRICKGPKPQDNAGPLNTRFADQLETALAIASRANTTSVKLVHKASATAAKVKNASHLSKQGREKLFAQSYALPTSPPEVNVDAFLTGVLKVSPDLKDIEASILLGRPEQELKMINQFNFKIDGQILNEIGEAFQLRAIGDDPTVEAQRVRDNPASAFPLAVAKPSVSLKVLYDGKPVELEFRDGGAWIPEPRSGQAVTMELKRLDQSPGSLGVVVKVNGENTLYRQRLRDVDCDRWLLQGKGSARTILGYYLPGDIEDKKNVEKFHVAAPEESEALEMYYGPDVGTISLVAFREATGTGPRPQYAGEMAEYAPDLQAIAKAQLPSEAASSASGENGVRGIIVAGERIADPLQIAHAHWSPEPVLSVVIRYYHPQPK